MRCQAFSSPAFCPSSGTLSLIHISVQEVLNTIEPVLAANSKYEAHAILERIVEPERTILFRVPWIDDRGKLSLIHI